MPLVKGRGTPIRVGTDVGGVNAGRQKDSNAENNGGEENGPGRAWGYDGGAGG